MYFSANALFGTLQVVTANQLGLNPVLMAAANSSGGVMGKMISLQSIAVAAAATGMARSEESNLLRFTLKHSVFLVVLIGLLAMFYTYVAPGWVRVKPGNADSSMLYQKVVNAAASVNLKLPNGTAYGLTMPATGSPLAKAKLDLIKKWITDGAVK